MSHKKSKAERIRARLAQQAQAVDSSNALTGTTIDNTPIEGLRLGWRALEMVARRPFAAIPMLVGVLLVWLPAAAVVANVVAVVLMGDGPGRETGLAFGFTLSLWLLAPIVAAAVIEAAFFMAHRGRVRWRVALASFGCEKGISWLVGASLFVGLGVQGVAVWAGRQADPGIMAGVGLALVAVGMLARIVVFLATTHLWAGEAGGRKAIAWAVCAIPRVVVAWASAMFVMLFAFLLLGTIIMILGWLVLVAGAMGTGVQVALSVLVLWPALLVSIAGLLVMEARIMLELHALAMTGPRKSVDPDSGLEANGAQPANQP